jgi:hypothetical protein
MEKFLKTVKQSDPDYNLADLAAIDEKFIDRLKKDTLERAERLKNAKASNYKDLMKEEDESYRKKKKPFFSRFKRKKS